jgi:lysophospholipase L1-like esterase
MKHFAGMPFQFVNRGIGGQTSQNMLARYVSDVIELKPNALIILAGASECYHLNVASTTLTANLTMMCETARAQGSEVFIGTVLPTGNQEGAQTEVSLERRLAYRNAVNSWIKRYCAQRSYHLVDYNRAMTDAGGLMRPEYFRDFIHPNEHGYVVMTKLLKAALKSEKT